MDKAVDIYQFEKGEPVVRVQGLSFELDGRPILKDVNFEARSGEITAILGGSGSGKTTVLKHLLGLYVPGEGEVEVLGRNPYRIDEYEESDFYRNLGVLFQEGALLNSLTVNENVGLPLEQHTDLPEEFIRKLVGLKLQLVELENTGDLYPPMLSGGMLKRAALARAIAMDPQILFCDEPGAGLDPVTLSQLDKLILKLKEMLGMTVVIVTHEVSSIHRIADRIVFLENGESVFEGSVQQALVSDIPALKDFFNAS